MTEYWVSQARRFCTYCKCWTADNKASIQFHEKGKRHTESVQKKIQELKKKGFQDAKAQDEMENAITSMEKAAFEAFKKDLKADPKLALQYGVKPQVEGPSLPPPPPVTEELKESVPLVEWYEAKSPDGHSYYWNTNTNATVWDKPDEFKSLEEQKEEKKAKKDRGSKTPTAMKTEESEPNTKIIQTSKAKFVIHTTKGKSRSLPGVATVETADQEQTDAPHTRVAGLSQWVTVETPVEDDPIDLELDLPVRDTTNDVVLPVFSEETLKRPKFKEKTVTSLGKKDDVAFKKRKICSGSRNTRRQRADSHD